MLSAREIGSRTGMHHSSVNRRIRKGVSGLDLLVPFTRPSTRERLACWYVPEPGTGCWLWRGVTDRGGYGVTSVGHKNLKAHRVMWELEHGPIPSGLVVCHRCDVRACVNPDHMFLGTHRDNNHDMMRKGRMRVARGESNGCAKLTEDDVRAIRTATGRHADIGSRFGVRQTTISAILRGTAWAHVSQEPGGSAMLAASSQPSNSSTSDTAGCRCSGASQCRQRSARGCTSQPHDGHHEQTIMSALIVAYEAGPE